MNNNSISSFTPITMNEEPTHYASLSAMDFMLESPRRINPSARRPCQSQTIAPETPKHRRVSSKGLFRHSMSHLHFSPVKKSIHGNASKHRQSSVGWGSESMTQLKLNLSISMLHSDESDHSSQKETENKNTNQETYHHKAVVGKLQQEVKDALQAQIKRKKFLDQVIESNIAMAKARYSSGSKMGAVLSMRKIFKDKSAAAYVSAARLRLQTLQQQVAQAADDASAASLLQVGVTSKDLQHALEVQRFEVAAQRQQLHNILGELTTSTHGRVPDNDTLLAQLRLLMQEV